jgi:hypothetical protein
MASPVRPKSWASWEVGTSIREDILLRRRKDVKCREYEAGTIS